MGQVLIRNLDDQVIESHRTRAKTRGVSLEQELRDVLTAEARLRREERVGQIDAALALTPALPLGSERTPGWLLIREDRESR